MQQVTDNRQDVQGSSYLARSRATTTSPGVCVPESLEIHKSASGALEIHVSSATGSQKGDEDAALPPAQATTTSATDSDTTVPSPPTDNAVDTNVTTTGTLRSATQGLDLTCISNNQTAEDVSLEAMEMRWGLKMAACVQIATARAAAPPSWA